MKVSVRDFEDKYLRRDEDSDLIFKTSPCTFLIDGKTFGIYDYRPQACVDYPHTNQRKDLQVLDLTLKNIEVCPAAAKISLEITQHLG